MKRVINILCMIAGVSLLSACGVDDASDSNSVPITEESIAEVISQETTPNEGISEETYEVLHIMSYHEGWEWTEMQLQGFKDALADYNVEYTIEAMDCKNHADDSYRNAKAEELQKYIDEKQPDLVYVSDDEALQYVVSSYRDSEIPFVFSCVNKSLEEYGLEGAQNVTGVYEVEHFASSFELISEIVPDIKDVIVIYDRAEMWSDVKQRMLVEAEKYSDVNFIFLDPIMTFEQYKQTILEYNGKVDALCLVGVFNYADENGNSVFYQDVLKWTEENSTIPDFSFWIDRIDNSTLCSVAISGYEQGYTAGELAKSILIDKVSPKDIETTHTAKGSVAINTKRAEKLGLVIDAELLLSAEVYNKYQWEE
ncbi:MAG: hypothetical protein IJF07_00730 [Lachnospiraceae bacterium]|nr:hypothetical protein [Lachnospiraceae bacterium]